MRRSAAYHPHPHETSRMASPFQAHGSPATRARTAGALPLALALSLAALGARPVAAQNATPAATSGAAPSPDPRVGLRAGANDAAEAVWNLKVVSKTPPSEQFVDGVNSDLAFTGNYVFQLSLIHI